ncbi:hypothetical protein [Vreelandella titanicae]|jgi:uncharacterized protein (DUF2249 family)|uniref:hypothetical protein n=1 Tax=Vreelandella titanicae TaxID=664683 RepID=UPI001593FA69|nr:hypothetical protein [Halomonas titanicae]NVE91568.1 hypothetical protein [Halomonas titanicae]|tara:strand:+ start:673 stop:1077 length:405 start_codon:yes stop_codon:yes gene_type:complete
MDKWKEIKERLAHLHGSVELLADGHKLSLIKVHDGKKIFVRVYVDGCVDFAWTKTEDGKPVHAQGQFWRPMKRAAYPKKHYAALKRGWGKKEADRMITPRVIAVVPDFGTEGAVVAHLKKHFPDLDIKADEVAS